MQKSLADFKALVAEADLRCDASIWRQAIELATHNPALLNEPHVLYELGLAWYEQTDSRERTANCERFLRGAITKDSCDWYAVLYLGHLLYDEGRYCEAITQFELIPGSAFATAGQEWRDVKRLELIVCGFLHLGLSEQAADAFEQWATRFASSDELDRAFGVYELPATLRQLRLQTDTTAP